MPKKKAPKSTPIKVKHVKRSKKTNKPQETQIIIHLTVDISMCIMNKDK